jgi:uroporphyrinogen III methyltransferase/synthase
VAVIGEVVKLRSKLNWFERRSLFGRRLVVTRAREQASQLSRQLRELGAEVLEVPTITFEPPTRREDIVDALLELNSYDWLVFTSPNGVTKFFEYFFRQFHDMRDLGGARIADRTRHGAETAGTPFAGGPDAGGIAGVEHCPGLCQIREHRKP